MAGLHDCRLGLTLAIGGHCSVCRWGSGGQNEAAQNKAALEGGATRGIRADRVEGDGLLLVGGGW